LSSLVAELDLQTAMEAALAEAAAARVVY